MNTGNFKKPDNYVTPNELWVVDTPIGDGIGLMENTYLASPTKPTEFELKSWPDGFIHFIKKSVADENMKSIKVALENLLNATELDEIERLRTEATVLLEKLK